jgi:GT2 family glycosyltransferase
VRYPRVFAITLNWNKKDDTIECVESLRRLTYPNYRIIVVDNGSTDGSAQALRESFPDIHVIENRNNLGYAIGFNRGMDYAFANGADYFLILNNDTVIHPEALTELVKTAQENRSVGFVSGKVYYFNDPQRLQTVGRLNDGLRLVGDHIGFREHDAGQYDRRAEYDFIDDIFLLVRRQVYETVGGYDKSFFLHWEETDWCARVRRTGFKIMYTPGAKLWHKGLLTVLDGITSSAFFYLTRNQIPFMWRNARADQFIRFSLHMLCKECPITIGRFLKYQKHKYIAPYLGGILSGYFWILRNLGDRGRVQLQASQTSVFSPEPSP